VNLICDRCGIQIESDVPLSRCKCGGDVRACAYPEPLERADNGIYDDEWDKLDGEYDYDPETGLDWPAEA